MNIKRKLVSIHTPPPQQGFLGEGHIARAVVQNNYQQSNPFFLLMDDSIEVPEGEPAGGPHPHAGFETVTLLLEGSIKESVDSVSKGDLEIMTAGSGIVHGEPLPPKTKGRILQLWLALPKKERWIAPRVQNLRAEHVPGKLEDGLEIKVYSGAFAGAVSPVKNYTPLLVAEIRLQSDVGTVESLPASFNTFLYVIEGSVAVGDEKKILQQGQVGWLDNYSGNDQSELKLTAGTSGARVVLYGGQPQPEPIVSHGPFIGDTSEDIVQLYKDYRQGKMQHVSTLPESQVMNY